MPPQTRFRTVLIRLAIALVLAAPAVAASQDGVAAPAAAVALVERLSGAISRELARLPTWQQTDVAIVVPLVEKHLGAHVDFERAARGISGRAWEQASAAQRAQVEAELRSLVFKRYALLAGSLAGARIDYRIGATRAGGKRVAVEAMVNSNEGGPLELRYYLRRDGARWLLFDVAVSGVRMLRTYRERFRPYVSEGGIDGLLRQLRSLSQP